MIVYVESNFILELAYLQEESNHCEKILQLAEVGKVNLILPAFAIAEPFSAWVGRKRQRQQLHEKLGQELRELGRSEPYARARETFQDVTKALLISSEEEKSRLDGVILRVLDQSYLIPIEASVVKNAIEFQTKYKLSPQDSIIYASVLLHLSDIQNDEKCFITKNSKDFASPDVIQGLLDLGCGLATNFGHGYGIIHKQLSAS
jgi:hypothetical protein